MLSHEPPEDNPSLWPFDNYSDPHLASQHAVKFLHAALARNADLSAVLADAYWPTPSDSSVAARGALMAELVALARRALLPGLGHEPQKIL